MTTSHETPKPPCSALHGGFDYYQGLELRKLLEKWKQDYDIETHPELIQ